MPLAATVARLLPILIPLLLAGCQQAGPAPIPPAAAQSNLAGQWRGEVLIRSTQREAAQVIHEDFNLTVRPDGRFELIGLAPGGNVERAGQRLALPGGGWATVLRADYQPDESHVVLDLSSAGPAGGPADRGGDAIRAGAAVSAWLLEDGQLEFELFSFSMSAQAADRCDAVSQYGILRRAEHGE